MLVFKDRETGQCDSKRVFPCPDAPFCHCDKCFNAGIECICDSCVRDDRIREENEWRAFDDYAGYK